jgi:hypothetical protein
MTQHQVTPGSGSGGVHVTVGSGSSKSDYHFSTTLFIATIAFIAIVGMCLGGLIFGFELLNRV